MSFQKDVGDTGEAIVRLFLMKQGHRIVSRNALGYGYELDIVSRYIREYFIVEVKSVSYETPMPGYSGSAMRSGLTLLSNFMSGGWKALFSHDPMVLKVLSWHVFESQGHNSASDGSSVIDPAVGAAYRVDQQKLLHVKRGIEVLIHKGIVPDNAGVSFEVITVTLDFFRKTAIIQRIPCEL